MTMDHGERCRSIGPPDERHVDPGLEQQPGEQAPVLVVRERAEIRHRDPETTERDRGVEWSAAGDRTEQAVFVALVDEQGLPRPVPGGGPFNTAIALGL